MRCTAATSRPPTWPRHHPFLLRTDQTLSIRAASPRLVGFRCLDNGFDFPAENVIEPEPGRHYERTFLRTELPESRIIGMMWDYESAVIA
ncbi:hypothetical protein EV647_0333 [Kribbella sp. VKM Ac-2566]|nr:hypothetical protein EV647_0333 [Kribbella sp. VKM Ac-2566]